MADTEAPVATAVESLTPAPVKVQRIKKPERPDKSALDATIASLQEKISANANRVSEIKSILDSKQSSRDASKQAVQVVRSQLTAMAVQSNDAMHQKNFLRESLSVSDAARKQLRDEAKAVRSSLKFTKMEDLNAKIQQLEHEMSHTTMDFSEEKNLAKEVKALELSKASVREYTARLDRIAEDEAGRAEQMKKIREKDGEITAFKKQENALKDTIRKMRDAEGGDQSIGDFIKERQAKYDEIIVMRKEIDAARGAFRKQTAEFQEQSAVWYAQQQEVKKKEYTEREAMRRERDARRKAWEEENYVEPYTDEIFICDQLTTYMQKLSGPADGGDSEKEVVGKSKVVAPAGFGNAIVSKKDREDEEGGLFGGMGAKKGKGKGPKPKPVKMMLTLDLLQSFGKISVPHPVSVADIPDTMEKVKEAKSSFKEKQLVEREKRAAAKLVQAEKTNGDAAEVEPTNGDATKVEEETLPEEDSVEKAAETPESEVSIAEAPKENGEGEVKVAENGDGEVKLAENGDGDGEAGAKVEESGDGEGKAGENGDGESKVAEIGDVEAKVAEDGEVGDGEAGSEEKVEAKVEEESLPKANETKVPEVAPTASGDKAVAHEVEEV